MVLDRLWDWAGSRPERHLLGDGMPGQETGYQRPAKNSKWSMAEEHKSLKLTFHWICMCMLKVRPLRRETFA